MAYIHGIKPFQLINNWDNPPSDFVLDRTRSKRWKLLIDLEDTDIDNYPIVRHARSLFEDENTHIIPTKRTSNRLEHTSKILFDTLQWYLPIPYDNMDTYPQYNFVVVSNSVPLLTVLSTALTPFNIHGSSMSARSAMRFINSLDHTGHTYSNILETVQRLYSRYLPLILPLPSYLLDERTINND